MSVENIADPTGFRKTNGGYMPIEHYGLIGNMHTAALVAIDGGIDLMCWPDFDSPSIFGRMLDKDKGGHFTITPVQNQKLTTKQTYLPSNNILQTRYMHEDGVLNLLDFFPRPSKPQSLQTILKRATSTASAPVSDLKKWCVGSSLVCLAAQAHTIISPCRLVRRVECIRGELELDIEVFPAFNYAQDKHTTDVKMNLHASETESQQTVIFKSKNLALQLVATIDCGEDEKESCPNLLFNKKVIDSSPGEGVMSRVTLKEGQAISFVLRDYDATKSHDHITTSVLDAIQRDTSTYWFNWISKSKYKGRWREVVNRSLMILKMLTYEPTGAIVAAPTFSLPEDFGGSRNWDYRFSWVRDSSFTIYILLRMGFIDEAEAYMTFISDRMKYSRTEDGGLPIMFSIRGDTNLPEIELTHLDGYRGSKPVRIGNGAAFHKQLDIYGELMDAVYLYNKYGKPVSYDQWIAVRELTDHVCSIWRQQDMSIWEVRGQIQNFVYSKILLWVALDRALRLSEKRSSFPCPNRLKWMTVRDEICEDIMTNGYNHQMQCFIQSYESNEVLDSAVLIAPLVFFISPNDPRFISTLDQILKPPEKGGLTSTGLVYRYNTLKSDDGE